MFSVSLMLAAAVSLAPQSPEAEYQTYLDGFRQTTCISGSFVLRGGPVGRPDVSTFQVWVGGIHAIHRSGRDTYCDGRSSFDYSPITNQYLVSSPDNGSFQALFGMRFCSGDPKPIQVESATDGEFDERKVRVFRFKEPIGGSLNDLYVNATTRMPVAVRTYTNQSQYTLQIMELDLSRKSSGAWKVWQPPKGAVKVDRLGGE